MSLVKSLIAFGLRQIIGEKAEGVAKTIEGFFTDHSKKLPNALLRANDRAWQALAMTLAGDSVVNWIKSWFSSADEKAFAATVREFLKSYPFENEDSIFREKCLAELTVARQRGLLSARDLPHHDIALHTACLSNSDRNHL